MKDAVKIIGGGSALAIGMLTLLFMSSGVIVITFEDVIDPFERGDRIFINNSKVFLSLEPDPVTVPGEIIVNLKTAIYNGGVTVGIGVDNNDLGIGSAFVFNPQNVTEEKSYSCDFPEQHYNMDDFDVKVNKTFTFNLTLNPKHSWCYEKRTVVNLTTNEVIENTTKLLFNHSFLRRNISSKTIWWNKTRLENWVKIEQPIQHRSFNKFGMTDWWFKDFGDVVLGVNNKIKINLVKKTRGDLNTKYTIFAKPSSQTFQQAFDSDTLFYIDPVASGTGVYYLNFTNNGGNAQTDISITGVENLTDYFIKVRMKGDAFTELGSFEINYFVAIGKNVSGTSNRKVECALETDSSSNVQVKCKGHSDTPTSDLNAQSLFDVDTDYIVYIEDTASRRRVSIHNENGTLINRKTQSFSREGPPNTGVDFGYLSVSDCWNCEDATDTAITHFDGVAVYNTTPDNENLPPNATNESGKIVSYYPFGEGSGSVTQSEITGATNMTVNTAFGWVVGGAWNATVLAAAADTERPQWFDNSSNNTVVSSNVLHSIRWTDNEELDGFIFSFANGSTDSFVNDTWIAMSGTSDHSNVTKFINNTVGAVIQWRIYANDTNSSAGFNVTDIFNYTTTVTDSCDCPSINTNWEIDLADSCRIYSDCDIGLGNITWINTGNATFNATIEAKNMDAPPTSGVLFIGPQCRLIIG